ncbi:MAG: hypothetical protein ABEK36_06430 [Candidatus Aenigmatarchaeota archaeon]
MREVRPDREKSKALFKMSKKILSRIEETNKSNFPTQVLRDYYTVIKQLMEAISSIEGLKSEGKGAHKKLINWICKEYGFSESKRKLLQQIRKYRNRINYEGFTIRKNYLERNEYEIEKIIKKLEEILKSKLEDEN